jgi:hypothetical protein
MWFDRGADKSGEDIPLVNSLDAGSPWLKGVPEAELEEVGGAGRQGRVSHPRATFVA